MNLFSNPLLSTASLKRAALDGLPDADELSLTEVENWTPLSVGVSRAHDECVKSMLTPRWVLVLLLSRSLHWKLSLSVLPSPAPQLFQTPLRTSRQAYDDLRFAYLRSPDGRYPADISVPPSHGGGDRASQAAAPSGPTPSGVFDPLSLEDTSPWKKYYKDLEVKKEIRKDVERTYVSALCSPSKDACFAREADLQPPIAASLTCPTSRRITLGSCSRQFCSCIAHCTPTSRTGRYVLPSTTVGHAGPELTRGPFCVAHSAGHARTRSCYAAGCRTRLPSCCR